MSKYMDNNSLFLHEIDNFSTGYLEDVLFEFNSKRRRLLMFSPDHKHAKDLDKSFMEILKSSSISCPKLESSDNNQWTPDKENLYCIDPSIFASGSNERKKKRVLAKVVYPFALVKPGGLQGDVTLNDINERILMPPTRPVRHPVGDFACRPLVSPVGPGLSGKVVVAFTKIHTQGRGTITIIRTRG